MRTEIITINDIDFKVKVKIENRENTRATLRNRSINISIPNFIPREEIFKEIIKMKSWAKESILKNPEKFKPEPIKSYLDNQEIQIRDDKYILNIEYQNEASSSARIKEKTIFLKISSNLSELQRSKHISTLISRCLVQRKLPEVKKRIEKLNSLHFQQDIKKIFLKYNQSNWGSCSEKGNINISTRALFTPSDVFDYLCIHELSHLIEQNHSEQFWSLVQKAMPDYKEKQKWLKQNGGNCKF